MQPTAHTHIQAAPPGQAQAGPGVRAKDYSRLPPADTWTQRNPPGLKHWLQETHDALLGDAKSLEEEIVNRHLVDFEAVISEESKAFWTEQLLGNRDAALGALGELAKSKATGVKPDADKSTRRPLHNRQTARPQNRGADGRPSPDADESRAVKIRNRAHELCKTEGIPFSVAFRRAETEIVGA